MVERLVGNGETQEDYICSGNSLVHVASSIAGDAVLVGPVLVGPGARVMSGAMIVGPTSIGCDATIGEGALVSRSAVWRRSVIGQRAVTDRCILADDTVVAPYAETFRTVMAARLRRHAETVDVGRSPVERREAAERGIHRKVKRALIGTSWSRSPAQ